MRLPRFGRIAAEIFRGIKMDDTFEISGKKFKLHKINAIEQYHLVCTLGPILSEMLPGLGSVTGPKVKKPEDVEKLTQDEHLEMVAKFISPVLNGLSKLPRKEREEVLYGLLSAVEYQGPGGAWARVATSDQLRFHNFELPLLLNLAGRAFSFNLSSFFPVPLQ
jgi:hypothetical protein